MSIEEKERVLEFSYIEGGYADGDLKYNIIYDPHAKFALNISGNGKEFLCSVSLFQEVTEFLQKKGIIKPTILSRETFPPTVGFSKNPNSLSLPSVQKIGEENKQVSVTPSEPIDQISSFDISTPLKSEEELEKDSSIPLTGPVISQNDKPEIVNRPVIRTRVNNDDPLSAEKEAAVLRSYGKKEQKRVVKRAQEKEGT